MNTRLITIRLALCVTLSSALDAAEIQRAIHHEEAGRRPFTF